MPEGNPLAWILKHMVEPDFYMPEFWPADKLLGKIFDAQLDGISAGKIVGLIVNEQVASLAAAKILGQLTNEQIEAIAAGKITGQLTDKQIAEIAAAKIVGQLTDEQLGGLSAAKLIGEIASSQISGLEAAKVIGLLVSGQIAGLEAAKVEGKLTPAQIESIEAAQITGQLTSAQILGLTTAKLEGLLTSAQIEGLAVAKLIGQISNSQIAAKAVTAGKIDVAELSAITVDAGVIEAGLFKGVTFESANGLTIMDNEGISIKNDGSEKPDTQLTFLDNGVVKKIIAFIQTRVAGETFQIISNGDLGQSGFIISPAQTLGTKEASVKAQATGASGFRSVLLIDDKWRSEFPRLPEAEKRRMLFGEVSAAGGKVLGSTGWTVTKLGTGQFRVNFTFAFDGLPACVATPSGGGQQWFKLVERTKERCQFNFYNSGFILEDTSFNFVVIG